VTGAVVILAATTGTVVFKAVENRASKLQMRTFNVNPRIFIGNLFQAAEPVTSTAVTNIFPAYLKSKGISIRPPKAVAFNENTGLLSVKATASDLNTIEKIVVQLNVALAQVHMKTSFIQVPQSDIAAVLAAGTVINTTNGNSVEILDADKSAQLLRLLSPNNSRTLAAPQVVTLAGQQTSMRAGDVSVDLVPTLLADGYTLKMKITAIAVEPMTAEVNIWDGQTIAISSQKSNGQSRLFVFISTQLIDPAGNLLHSKARLPFKPGTIPPQ